MGAGKENLKGAVALPRSRTTPSLPEDIDFYEFANSLAHEIRNPLNALVLNLKLLSKEIDGNPGEEKLQAALAEVRRLDDIVTAFLRFARPKKPRLVLLRLKQVLNEFRIFISPEATKRGVTLEFDVDRAGIVLSDGDLLKQTLLNLVLNSFEAGARNVRVAAEENAGGTIITVADDGPGVKEPEKVFEPFFSTKPEGTGLGLSTARIIVKALGGELELNPSSQGAAFSIRIPKTPTETPPIVV